MSDTTNLLDSFLYEVGQHLPLDQRTEILTDLRASIEDELNGVEEVEGREATEDEFASLTQPQMHLRQQAPSP